MLTKPPQVLATDSLSLLQSKAHPLFGLYDTTIMVSVRHFQNFTVGETVEVFDSEWVEATILAIGEYARDENGKYFTAIGVNIHGVVFLKDQTEIRKRHYIK